jgi:predicted thioesterase
MRDLPPDLADRYETVPGARETAAAVGNAGVEVVGTPFLIGYFELAADRAIRPYCEPGEVSVGTRIEVDHLAAAVPGRLVSAEARVVATEGRRIDFAVEVHQGARLLMRGKHRRTVVRLERLLARAAAAE